MKNTKKRSVVISIVGVMAIIALAIFVLFKMNVLYNWKLDKIAASEFNKKEFNVNSITYRDIDAESMISALESKGWNKLGNYEKDDNVIYLSDRELDGSLVNTGLEEITEKFLGDSNLKTELESLGIEYKIKVSDDGTVLVCPVDEDNSSYIRLAFIGEKECEECSIYLYENKSLGVKKAIGIEKVLKDEGIDTYSELCRCEDFEVYYKDGLPYYRFSCQLSKDIKAINMYEVCAVEEN